MAEPMGERVARVETKIDSYHAEVKRIFEEEIVPLKKTVARHEGQFKVQRGVQATLGVLWAAVLAYLGGHRHP